MRNQQGSSSSSWCSTHIRSEPCHFFSFSHSAARLMRQKSIISEGKCWRIHVLEPDFGFEAWALSVLARNCCFTEIRWVCCPLSWCCCCSIPFSFNDSYLTKVDHHDSMLCAWRVVCVCVLSRHKARYVAVPWPSAHLALHLWSFFPRLLSPKWGSGKWNQRGLCMQGWGEVACSCSCMGCSLPPSQTPLPLPLPPIHHSPSFHGSPWLCCIVRSAL